MSPTGNPYRPAPSEQLPLGLIHNDPGLARFRTRLSRQEFVESLAAHPLTRRADSDPMPYPPPPDGAPVLYSDSAVFGLRLRHYEGSFGPQSPVLRVTFDAQDPWTMVSVSFFSRSAHWEVSDTPSPEVTPGRQYVGLGSLLRTPRQEMTRWLGRMFGRENYRDLFNRLFDAICFGDEILAWGEASAGPMQAELELERCGLTHFEGQSASFRTRLDAVGLRQAIAAHPSTRLAGDDPAPPPAPPAGAPFLYTHTQRGEILVRRWAGRLGDGSPVAIVTLTEGSGSDLNCIEVAFRAANYPWPKNGIDPTAQVAQASSEPQPPVGWAKRCRELLLREVSGYEHRYRAGLVELFESLSRSG